MIIVINLKFNDTRRKLFIQGSISMNTSINQAQNLCYMEIYNKFHGIAGNCSNIKRFTHF